MSDDENRPRVGYGHPPEHTRFKPGQSGNPKGRPKGHRNFGTDLREVLAMTVEVKVRGKARTLTSQQAMLFRLLEKALKGENRASQLLLDLAARYNGEAPAHDSDAPLPDEDRAILEQYLPSVLAQAPDDATTEDQDGGPAKPGQEGEDE